MKRLVMTLAVLGLALPALADVVHLKNGGSLEGSVSRTPDGVVVKLPVGEVRISNDAIERIEPKVTAFEQYQQRAAAVREDDPEAHYRLGLWAQQAGLKGPAREEFRKTVALKPDHALAHQALGHRLVDGRWLTHEDEMRARGLVEVDGAWMSPEAAAKLRALQAELELARERRKTAEAELEKAKSKAGSMPVYESNPYDTYYSTREMRRSRTYYWAPPYDVPYYTGTFIYTGPRSSYRGSRYHTSPYHRRRR